MKENDERSVDFTGFPDTKDGLKNFFIAAYGIFNQNTDPTIGGALDENITVFSITEHKAYTGVNAVVAYFADQFLDKPQFTPTAYRPDISSDGVSGSVTGTAKWVDENGTENLHFVFKLVYNSNKNQWLFLNMYAK
jgi:hypothetical protein